MTGIRLEFSILRVHAFTYLHEFKIKIYKTMYEFEYSRTLVF